MPRVRLPNLWRVAPAELEEAQDDATVLAIRDQERAGLDIITDGEQRRESYSNRFATALDGIDLDNPGKTLNRAAASPGAAHGGQDQAQASGRAARSEIPARQYRQAGQDHGAGPVHHGGAGQDDYYGDEEKLAMDYAAAVNAEIKDLFAAGADVVQIDEPWMQQQPEKAKRYGIKVLDRALDGVKGTTAVHICFGYAAVVADKPPAYHVPGRIRAVEGRRRSRSRRRSPSSTFRS